MNITFHTNLDAAKPYVHRQTDRNESYWTHVPAVGSFILFDLSIEPKGSTFSLEVVEVVYSADGQECRVELHIPHTMKSVDNYPQGMSVHEWTKWLRKREKYEAY